MDFGGLLSYRTKKQVRIKDARLGCLYAALMSSIACWLLGYQILYMNFQFDRYDVQGVATLTIQQPTKDGCNPLHRDCKSDFRPLAELPYCTEYTGTGDQSIDKHRCIFADKHTLNPEGAAFSKILLPTRKDTIGQEKGCKPHKSDGFTCDNEWNIVKESDVVYVADIERVTMKISHFFSTHAGGEVRTGSSRTTPGFYRQCAPPESTTTGSGGGRDPRIFADLAEDRECPGEVQAKQIECIAGDHCGRAHPAGGEAGEDAGSRAARLRQLGVFAIPQGDIFTVGKLLDLAGLSLDESRNKDGEPLRLSGSVLIVDVLYNNLRHFTSSFGDTQVSYHYNVRHLPSDEMKMEIIDTFVPGAGDRRNILDIHGIYIMVKVRGEIGHFSFIRLVLLLGTSMGCFAVAAKITDIAAFWAKPHELVHGEEAQACLPSEASSVSLT